METRLAFIFDNFYISWFALFVTIGCIAGTVVACLLRHRQGKYISDIFICVTFGVPLGLFFARLFYCVFSLTEFNSFGQVIALTNGGYGLYGGILGVFLSAVIAVKLFDSIDDLGGLLDCLATGGALAITVGRFATCFTGSELGYEVNFSFMTVYDPVQDLNTFAVYWLDGLLEAAIFITCYEFFQFCLQQGRDKPVGGKTALVMLALHGANQVLCDSMRADALKLGLNEFIKIAQILGIVSCIVILVYFIVLSIRSSKLGLLHIMSFIIMLQCIAFGVLAEYRVGNGNYISKHLMMLWAMILLCVMVVHYAKLTVVRTRVAKKTSTEKQPKRRARALAHSR